jgi:hypothetical protein
MQKWYASNRDGRADRDIWKTKTFFVQHRAWAFSHDAAQKQ